MTFFLHESHYRNLAPAAEQLVTICGAGALGANLAETLARMGLRRLRVIDRDRIETHNLSTQPWMQQDVGGSKARVLANVVYRAVGARLEAHAQALTADNAAKLLSGSTVVVDAFDNLSSRAAVGAAARAINIPCLHIALSGTGDYGCGLWDDAYDMTDERGLIQDGRNAALGCNYPLTRPLALLMGAAAAEVLVDYLLTGGQRAFTCTLRDLCLTAT